MDLYIKVNPSKDYVTKNFQRCEWFYPDFSWIYRIGHADYMLSTKLIQAAQFVREFIKVPCFISSVYRPLDTYGFHRFCKAFDLHCGSNSAALSMLKNELKDHNNNPELFKVLRKTGITGFGIESDHLHFDIRDYCFNCSDPMGNYQFFEIS